MRLSFGKHRGTSIDDLPDGYLQWLFWLDTLQPDVEKAVKTEVLSRWPEKIVQVHRITRTKSKSPNHQARIKTIFRELALRYHPDTGGNTEAMQAINEFMEKLEAL